jgi:hypothetical protein
MIKLYASLAILIASVAGNYVTQVTGNHEPKMNKSPPKKDLKKWTANKAKEAANAKPSKTEKLVHSTP